MNPFINIFGKTKKAEGFFTRTYGTKAKNTIKEILQNLSETLFLGRIDIDPRPTIVESKQRNKIVGSRYFAKSLVSS